MKRKILTSIIFSSFTFFLTAQNLTNQDIENFTSPPGTTPPGAFPQLLTNESFRFRSGIVTQLQSGSAFDFTNSEWFALGKVTSGQTFYGMRFQQPGRGLTFGYTNASANNPRIEWIHNGTTTTGNLEFRVGANFTSGVSTLVTSMTPQGNTYFGTANPALFATNNPLVGVGFNGQTGFMVTSNGTVPSSFNSNGLLVDLSHSGSQGSGVFINSVGSQTSYGIFSRSSSQQTAIGVYGATNSNATFTAAIYGDAQISGGLGSNLYAGYFNGDIATTAGFYEPSDIKLKENIVNEKSALEQIVLLRPVTYTYKKTKGMALPEIDQHGFISQELAEVFPELTKNILHPVFDEEGKLTSELNYKAINYIGLISVLTAGIQELNNELTAVRQELEDYKANDNVRSQLLQNNNTTKGYSMEQNIPNPFADQCSVRYRLASGVNQATISIFNLNGSLIKEYNLDKNEGEISILASEIGKGMFIYSLNQNGQEIISKRLIVK
jgi:hypothetical protein